MSGRTCRGCLGSGQTVGPDGPDGTVCSACDGSGEVPTSEEPGIREPHACGHDHHDHHDHVLSPAPTVPAPTVAVCRICGKTLGFPRDPDPRQNYYCSVRCYEGGADSRAGACSTIRDDSGLEAVERSPTREQALACAREVLDHKTGSYVQAAADLARYLTALDAELVAALGEHGAGPHGDQNLAARVSWVVGWYLDAKEQAAAAREREAGARMATRDLVERLRVRLQGRAGACMRTHVAHLEAGRTLEAERSLARTEAYEQVIRDLLEQWP